MSLSASVMTNVVAPKIEETFPWIQYLDESEQGEFWLELLGAFHRAMQDGDWSALKQTVADWKATAEVKAQPALESALSQNIEQGEWLDWEDARAQLQGRRRKKGAEGA